MKRLLVLGLLLGVGSAAMAVRAFQQPPAGGQAPGERVVQVERLKDNLYVLRGGGGNTAVFIGSTGVVVVDTKNPGWGQPILAKIQELTDKPVTTIVNTHTHGDHVSGNVEFPTTVEIVVHENTRANMEAMRPVTGLPQQQPPTNIFKAHNGRGLPTRTFKDQMSLGSGPDRVDLYYFGRGHTDGDAWVVFPSLRVVHAGDLFSGKNLPLLDANNGGSGVAIGETLARAHAKLKDAVDSVITGHSTVMSMADLAEYAQFNREFLQAIRDAKAAGKTVDEVASSWTMPAKYVGYAAPQPARLRSNIEVIYNELK